MGHVITPVAMAAMSTIVKAWQAKHFRNNILSTLCILHNVFLCHNIHVFCAYFILFWFCLFVLWVFCWNKHTVWLRNICHAYTLSNITLIVGHWQNLTLLVGLSHAKFSPFSLPLLSRRRPTPPWDSVLTKKTLCSWLARLTHWNCWHRLGIAMLA